MPLDGSFLGTHAFNSMHASSREHFFQFSAYSKAFATFLKSYRKPMSASHMKYCINLILGEAFFVHVFIFFYLQDSERAVLNSFDFNF